MDSKSCDHGGATTTISAVHTDVIESHILTKCDGASLACAASTSHLLHKLCNKESLWEDTCNSTWSSIKDSLVRKTILNFPGGYRAFFSDAFPVIRQNPSRVRHRYEGNISELISAVDINYGDEKVFSKVIVTKTDDKSFLQFSFWVDLLETKETVKIPLKFEGDENKCMLELEQNLKLSWIVIDPSRKRAVNVSSLRPVSVKPSCNGYDNQVIFATILSGDYDDNDLSDLVECRVAATLGCKEGKNVKFRELNLYLEDMHMRRLSGKKSLRILEEAMESGERKKGNGGEMKEIYEKYLELKGKKMEGKKRKERWLNLVYRLSWVAYLIGFVFLCISLKVFPN
ncbi:putative F-box family protein [Heracleum sosnowskyi]|uniref:F-box family protein n=1 Tax=Heracleum sosnowskyi TaxID=360622 RepID=A0AAD8GUL0_9APIA|nr:putative F-box family protein [Heracleum sosnowskyi]